MEKYIAKISECKSDEEAKKAETLGAVITDFGFGVTMRMDKYPYLPKKGEKNGDYGVPVAASLLLRICAEGAVLFLIVFALSGFAVYDNRTRFDFRKSCRYEAAYSEESYAILTNQTDFVFSDRALAYSQVETRLGFKPESCGYTGLDIRPFNTTDLDDNYYAFGLNSIALNWALGGCQEYRNCNTTEDSSCQENTLPRGPTDAKKSLEKLLVDTPDAIYCLGHPEGEPWSTIASLASFINVLLFIAFFIRIRYLSRQMAEHDDEQRITTADYSIAIDGLDTTIEPTQLRRRLRAEIEALSFEGNPNHFKDEIHHLEVGRHCRAEVDVMNNIQKLELACEEVHERMKFKEREGERTNSEAAALKKAVPKFIKLNEEIKKLVDEPDVATGHAYIAFKHELARNQFYQLFNQPAKHAKAEGDKFSSIEEGSVSSKNTAPMLEVASAESKRLQKKHEERANWKVQLKWIGHYFLGLESEKTGLNITSAPEPREVNWRALELDDAHENKVLCIGRTVTYAIILLGVFCLLGGKVVQFVFRESGPTLVPDFVTRFAITNLILCCVSGVTMIFNLGVRMITAVFVDWEGQDTMTEVETSRFRKLSVGLGCNTVAVPFIVALFLSSGNLGDQTWYEPGGIISQMLIIIIASWCTDILIVFNAPAILAKHIKSRFAYSSQKVVALWEPVPFYMGQVYAFGLVIFALGMLYGPLYPIAYLLSAIGLTMKYLCTRFGMRHWYGLPPTVDQEMMMSLRYRLGQVLYISIIAQGIAMSVSEGEKNQGPAFFIVIGGSIACFLYMIAPLGYIPALARFDQLASSDSLDTGGLSFDDACEKRGLPMPHYICPTLVAEELDEREQMRYDQARQALAVYKADLNRTSLTKEDSTISGGGSPRTPGMKKIRGGAFNLRYMHAVRTEDAIVRLHELLDPYGCPPATETPRAAKPVADTGAGNVPANLLISQVSTDTNIVGRASLAQAEEAAPTEAAAEAPAAEEAAADVAQVEVGVDEPSKPDAEASSPKEGKPPVTRDV